MKTFTQDELDTKISISLQENIDALTNLELIEAEITRLSANLDLNEAIEQQDSLFNQAAKNLNLEYLVEEN